MHQQYVNVHTVQKAAEMFANASTDSKSPEQLCFLTSLSISALHGSWVFPGNTPKYENKCKKQQVLCVIV